MNSYIIENGQVVIQTKTSVFVQRDPTVFIKGDQEEQGEQGEQGDPGPPLLIKGNLNSVADLPLNPVAGDGYLINGILYTWTGAEWINGGQIQVPRG